MWLRFAIGAAALALASCGGEGQESSGGMKEATDPSGGLESAEPVALPEGSTPKAKYVRRVNDICAFKGTGFDAEVERVLFEQAAAGRSGVDAFTRALAEVFPLIEEQYERIYSIPPPRPDRTDLERYWGYVRQALETSKEYFEAYEDGDAERLARASAALDQQELANAFAKSYGIGKCTGFTDAEATGLGTELGADSPDN